MGRPTAEPCAFPCEVFAPRVAPRVEEGHDGAAHGIHTGDVRPLGGVTEEAGEREVRGIAPAAVLPGDDVVDLKRQRGVRPGEVTILASCGRAPTDEPGCRRADPAHAAPVFFKESRARDCISSRNRPMCL